MLPKRELRKIIIYYLSTIVVTTHFAFSGEGYWSQIGPSDQYTYRCMAIDPQNPNTYYTGSLNKSTDAGKTWQYWPDPFTGKSKFLIVHPKDSNLVYGGGWLATDIKRSTDGGKTFQSISEGLPDDYDLVPGKLAVHPDITNVVFIASGNNVFKSVDQGDSWVPLGNEGLPTLATLGLVVINPKNPDIMYTSSYGGTPADPAGWSEYGVYKSEDAGETWRQVWGADNHNNIDYLNIDPITPDTLYIAGIPGTWRTKDGGISWEAINNGIQNPNDNQYILIHPKYHNILYCNQGEGYYSYDFGDNWILLPMDSLDYQQSVQLGLFAVHPITNTIYAGGSTTKNIWELTLPAESTNIKTMENNNPDNYFIQQNFPNPFNPFTTIQYNIIKPSNVKLKVYNLIGHELITLVDEFQNRGEYQVIWNPKNIPSGIYIYQIQVGNKFKNYKMVFQK